MDEKMEITMMLLYGVTFGIHSFVLREEPEADCHESSCCLRIFSAVILYVGIVKKKMATTSLD